MSGADEWCWAALNCLCLDGILWVAVRLKAPILFEILLNKRPVKGPLSEENPRDQRLCGNAGAKH